MTKRNPISRLLSIANINIHKKERNSSTGQALATTSTGTNNCNDNNNWHKHCSSQSPPTKSNKVTSLSHFRPLSDAHIIDYQVANHHSSYKPPTPLCPNNEIITMGNKPPSNNAKSNHNGDDDKSQHYHDIENNDNAHYSQYYSSSSQSTSYSFDSHDKYDTFPINPITQSLRIPHSQEQQRQQQKIQQHSYTQKSSQQPSSSTHALDYKTTDVDDLVYNEKGQQYYSLDELVDQNIYVVKQKVGYFSVGLGIIQTVILIAMMIECGIAPLNMNPMIGPYPDALDYWGAKNASKILDDNEWWRLITPLFLHGGIFHLLGNVSVQLDIGVFYEREWGSLTWVIIYMSSGIGSSIFSCIFNPDNLSVGSSGAVMGLFGGKLGEIFCRQCESRKTRAGVIGHEVRKEQLTQSLCAVILVLAFSFVPFVDWAAHLGGVIVGFITGILCFSLWIKTQSCASLWFLVGIFLNVAFYSITLSYLFSNIKPRGELRDVCEYYKQFFEDYQCNCQIENNNK